MNTIKYNYEAADYLLHTGYNVRGKNIEVSVDIHDNKLIDLLNAFVQMCFSNRLKYLL